MDDMKYLSIQGHETRNEEVIKLLEMLGGKNTKNFCGGSPIYYFIESGEIRCNAFLSDKYKRYTLEEFFQKFPFKVGDMVGIPDYESDVKIVDMKYFCLGSIEHVSYKVYCDDEEEWYTEGELLSFGNDIEDYECCCESDPEKSESFILKSEVLGDIPNEKENNDGKFLLPDGFNFQLPEGFQFINDKGEVINTTKIILERIKSKYPKTYEECCDKLDFKGGFREIFLSENEYSLYTSFIKLIRCRDSYWKIAGEEMGLGKPWRPDWSTEYERKYVIEVYRNKVRTNSQGYSNTLLAFPTEEMRDAFYENFKDLIERCKELI